MRHVTIIQGSALFAAAMLAGCGADKLADPLYPTGSQTVARSVQGDAIFAVNQDEGTVSRYDLSTEAVTTVAVGAEPTRLAQANGKLLVTLRGERGIAVLDATSPDLTLERTVATGTEPYGIVASEDGSRVYVALSTQDEIDELDGATLDVLRTWHVEGQPRWLALHPSGHTLFSASAYGGQLVSIDLDRDDAVDAITLPSEPTFDGSGTLTIRLTGDPAVTPDGDTLVIPALYLDNVTPVEDPNPQSTTGGYASTGGGIGMGISRFNPAVIEVPLGHGGDPNVGGGIAMFLGGDADFDGATTEVRSYPTSVAISPDSAMMMVTMESSKVVVAMATDPMGPSRDTCKGCEGEMANELGTFRSAPMSMITAGAGPHGVVFADDGEAYVHNFLDRSLQPLRADRVRSDLAGQFQQGFVLQTQSVAPAAVPLVAPADFALPPDAEAGRRLFFSAVSSQMSVEGSGVSCSTCHMDGRNDGVTWTFVDGVRQTPSLAGKVSLTAPLTWTNDVEHVADEVQITSQGRMGGKGLTDVEEGYVAAYVDFTREVDHPGKGVDSDQIERGKAIFAREDVGCATCHTQSNGLLTDNADHDLFGLQAVNTPTLVGVAATAPYLHDGSAKDMDAVLDRTDQGLMGNTGMLSADEKADLKAYLLSL